MKLRSIILLLVTIIITPQKSKGSDMTNGEISINNGKLYCEYFGNSSNPACILISGAGASCRFWSDELCEKLSKDYFVVRYDHRDTGLSSAYNFETHSYALKDLADDVIALMDTLHIASAHLVGHSMGGYIAQEIASRYPEKTKSVTCISAGPIFETRETTKPFSEKEQKLFETTWQVMLENKPTKNFEESLAGYMKVWRYLNGSASLDEKLAKEYTRDMYERTLHPVGVAQNHVAIMEEVRKNRSQRNNELKKLTMPFLIIHGEEDPLVLLEHEGRGLFNALPHAQLFVIPKMGHMFFNRVIENTIAEHLKKHMTAPQQFDQFAFNNY